MAKVIPEEEKNYNKFPGEHVIVLDDVVTIGDKVFHLVHNYQDGFDKEKLEQRYSDIFAKHDYVVGDWGHEQLRLKGFFSASRKKMPDDLKISHLEDYIKEYMNYGAAFFVLKRMRSKDIKREAPFLAEKVYEVKPTVSSETRSKKVVAKSQKRDVAQGASQARQSQSKQIQSKQAQAAKLLPLDKLLVETDAPYLAPMPFRGRENTPAYTKFVVEKIAELREISSDEVADATYQNALKVFDIHD